MPRKHNKGKSSTVTVNVNSKQKQPLPRKPKQRKRGTRRRVSVVPRGLRSPAEDGYRKFKLAIQDPFHPDAMGCRVPDPYSFPTMTYHLHGETIIQTPSGSSYAGVLFLPNPYISQVSLTSNYIGSSTMANVGVATSTYGATTPALMSNIGSDYRVVAWGIKISNIQPQLSATGRIMIAQAPCGDSAIGYNALSSTVTTGLAVAATYTGIGLTALTSASLLQLPTGVEVSVTDLLHGSLQVSGLIQNVSYYNFHNTINQNSYASGFITGDEVLEATATSTVAQIDEKEVTLMNGASAIMVYIEGLPTSSTQSTLLVEYIYHLEMTPAIASGTNQIPISSSSGDIIIGTNHDVELALNTQSSNKVMKFLTSGEAFLNKATDVTRAAGRTLSNVSAFGGMAMNVARFMRPLLTSM